MISTAHTSLSLPLAEDSMEVSTSPAATHFDDIDIDIDFGDYGATGAHGTDDERMFEDGEPTRPATATDDMMDDADNTTTAPVFEEVMQDGLGNDEDAQQDLPDEELIDYDDDTFDDPAQPTFDEIASTNTKPDLAISNGLSTESDHAKADISQGPEEDVAEPRRAGLTEHTKEPEPPEPKQQTAPADGTLSTDNAVGRVHEDDSTEQDGQRTGHGEESVNDVVEDVQEGTATTEGYGPDEEEDFDEVDELEAPPQLSGSLDTRVGHPTDTPPTPTDTGLHPLTVKFEGLEMPLFRSHVQPDGLLKDDNLVSVSLADLLHNCRQRLQLRTGEVISEDQEFTMAFDRLGLVVNESSRSASAVSLNDVLEVYLHLHENDGIEDIPAMSISLSRLLRFTSSFNVLKQAASQGQGISSFSFLDSSNHGDAYQELDGEEHPTEDLLQQDSVVHDTDDIRTGIQDFAEKDQAAEDLAGQADGPDQEHSPESTQDHHGGERRESEYPHDRLDGSLDHEEYPDPEDDDENFGDTDTYKTDANDNTAAPDRTQDTASQVFDHVVQRTINLESAASSVTVGCGTANDGNGEYNTDINNFDEELNEDRLDTYAAEGDDAPPPHLPVVEFEAGHLDSVHVAQATADIESSSVVDEQGQVLEPVHHGEQTAADVDVEEPHPEDNSELPREQQSHDHANYVAEDYGEAGEGLVQYEDDEYNQADNIDYTDQGELQPGDDDEQFHTAFDLLEDEEVEHLEQDGHLAGLEETTYEKETDDDDDIGFDDDPDFGDHPAAAPLPSPYTPQSKRSFEELADEDEFDLEEPELKKVRAD